MSVKCIIVDDEPIAHRVIGKYCEDLPFLEIVDNSYDAIQALDALKRQPVDLIFLDINMPKLKGFDFLRTLDNPPEIIVTSAYQEYALEGFELNVCDYLLKPFSFERFLKAVNKVMDALSRSSRIPSVSPGPGRDSLFIKGDKKLHQVKLDQILYIEACGNYSNVILTRDEIMTPEKISSLEKVLPGGRFIRVHKSYIAAIDRITEIEGNRISFGKKSIPVGRVYKGNVDRLVGGG